MKRSIYLIISLILVVLDQASKKVAIENLAFTCNKGIAWGIKIPGFLFIALWILITAIIFWLFVKSSSRDAKIGYCLILAGALSNIIDRIFHGCVVDFIQTFSWFPAFNLADALITIGAIITVVESQKVHKVYKDS